MILVTKDHHGNYQKKQDEEDERVRKEIKEYEQVKIRGKPGQGT